MAMDRTKRFAGFHTRLSDRETAPALVKLIEEGLAPLGVNNIILEFNPGYRYECFPKYSTGTFGKEEAALVRAACERANIRIIPMFQCLSHQSNFTPEPWPLFKDHPEFLETPNVPADADWPEYYNHSWCASNDGIYDYVFPMIDELIEVFNCDIFHIGIDEVFDIADRNCPLCAGKDPAELLARTVNILYDHIKGKGLEVMMWGDRLLDARAMGYHMWEADTLGMHPSFDMIPKDIIINDWHYDLHDHGYPSFDKFHQNGFCYTPATYNDLNQALHLYSIALNTYYTGNKMLWPGRMMGFLCTQWTPMTPEIADVLLKTIKGEKVENPPKNIVEVGTIMKEILPLAAQGKRIPYKVTNA